MPRPPAPGSLIARVLSGSWRVDPPPLHLDEAEVSESVPVLMATGCAGLAWWRLRCADAGTGEGGRTLHDAFRIQTLDARLHEGRLARVAALLAERRIDYVLAKGWAVARLYARPGLRPYGDLDVFVAPRHHEQARVLLAEHDADTARVDLHKGVPLLETPWEHVRERVEQTEVEGVPVRILGPEDHLALLGVHLFFHGAWRPIWLSDVAAFVEALPDGFDWTRLGTLSRRTRELCWATVLLAGRLLDADLDRTPWAAPEEPLPAWLPAAVLGAWGRGGHYSVTTRMGLTEPTPRALLRAVRVRWPNPVEVTYRWRLRLNRFPRLPFQMLDVASRMERLWTGRARA